VGRLAFEVAFDIVPVAAVFDGWWLKRGLRDWGHHLRMLRLWKSSRGRIGWLKVL
jgi:hypothetical protein